MNPIDERYYARLNALGKTGCADKGAQIFGEVCEIIGHQIDRAAPGLTPRERKIRIAERIYMNEPDALRMLQRARERDDHG